MSLVLLLIILLTAIAAYLPRSGGGVRRTAFILGIIGSFVGFWTFLNPLLSQRIHLVAHIFRIDMFGAFMGLLIVTLYFFTVLVSDRYIHEEYEEGILDEKKVRLYFFLLPLFVFAMLIVVMADNLGLLWLALETTTLATTPLVAIYKKDGSLEAAWKYMILCSLGISLGLLGLLFINYAGVHAGLTSLDAFSLTALRDKAPEFIPDVMKWAFVFTFVGLGTKVGFFPLHTWLPDAHGRTPSPISAMLSGILLNTALYALLRVKGITDLSLGGDTWTNHLFLVFGLLSIVTSAFFLFIQRNYKRMLAYSSMEHMGLISVAVALGPVGLTAAVMHMFAHTFSKSLLFYGSGEILLATKTTKIDKIKSLVNYMPKTVALFMLGLVSILGFPPFAAFASEILMLSAALQKGYLSVFLIIIASLGIIAVSLFKHALLMFARGENDAKLSQRKEKERWNITHVVMLIEVIVLIVGGVWMFTSTGQEFFSNLANSIY